MAIGPVPTRCRADGPVTVLAVPGWTVSGSLLSVVEDAEIELVETFGVGGDITITFGVLVGGRGGA